jgi:hypothetical protein
MEEITGIIGIIPDRNSPDNNGVPLKEIKIQLTAYSDNVL